MKKNYLSRQSFKPGILVTELSADIPKTQIIKQTFLFTGGAITNSSVTIGRGEFGGGLTGGIDTYFSPD